MGATTAERRCWFAPKSASTSTRTGSRYRTSTAPARVGRRYETKRTSRDAFPGYGGCQGASAGAIEGDQAHRSERCQDRSRTVSAASARLRWHLKYCVAPGGYTFTRTLDHGGLDLYTPMFAPCLLGCPGTGRQDPVLMSLRLAGLRYSSACHSIPATQVFKKVSLSSGLLIPWFMRRISVCAPF